MNAEGIITELQAYNITKTSSAEGRRDQLRAVLKQDNANHKTCTEKAKKIPNNSPTSESYIHIKMN